MLKLRVNVEAMEAIMYYWEATSDREKVNERFLNQLAILPAMTLTYDEEFTAESVRKVLSAITNREPLRPSNRKEGRFFNNNLWMLEDLSLTREMLAPIKTLNLDSLAEKLGSDVPSDQTMAVYFAPLHIEDCYLSGQSLVINFFRLQPDFVGGVKVGELNLVDFIENKLREMLSPDGLK